MIVHQASSLGIQQSLVKSEESKLNTNNKVYDIAESALWYISGIFNPITDFFTQGLSDFLVLETLRHGTSWHNYINIRKKGVDPTQGGGDNGSCAGIEHAGSLIENFIKNPKKLDLRGNSKGFFFVFADSHLGKVTHYYDVNGEKRVRTFTVVEQIFLPIYVRWEPHACAFMTGVSQSISKNTKKSVEATSTIDAEEAIEAEIISTIHQIASGLINMIAPVLKIHMRKEDVDTLFETDPLLPGRALRTKSPIGTEYIGLKGIFKQANDGCVLKRITTNPKKSLRGLVRLVNPIGLSLVIVFGIYSSTQTVQPSLTHKVKKIDIAKLN